MPETSSRAKGDVCVTSGQLFSSVQFLIAWSCCTIISRNHPALAYYNYTGVDQAIIRSTPDTADTRYYHNDGLGSAVVITNAAGATQASTRYDSWGNAISGGNIPQFGFTGREPDATGLMYFWARYYDPGMGRFTQRDPIGFRGGLNPYCLCE